MMMVCRERGSICTREVDRWRRWRKVLARDLGKSIRPAIYYCSELMISILEQEYRVCEDHNTRRHLAHTVAQTHQGLLSHDLSRIAYILVSTDQQITHIKEWRRCESWTVGSCLSCHGNWWDDTILCCRRYTSRARLTCSNGNSTSLTGDTGKILELNV